MKKQTVLPGETLAQFVKRIREANQWSTRDVERQSDGAISDGYINMIETGVAANPSPKKLKALAKGLKLEPESFNPAIYQVSSTSSLTEGEQILLNEYRSMDKRGQSDLLKIVRVLGSNDGTTRLEVHHQPHSDEWEAESPKTPTKKVRKTLTKSPK
jgi:transcriptional regulator with XRE-family HTH domain